MLFSSVFSIEAVNKDRQNESFPSIKPKHFHGLLVSACRDRKLTGKTKPSSNRLLDSGCSLQVAAEPARS